MSISRVFPSAFLTMVALITASISLPLAQAGTEPLVKQGACPSGYRTQGDYCVPGSNARATLPKSGSCPAGYYTSGRYCVAGKNAKSAIPKIGSSCPAGWYTSGKYCMRSR
ncbi:hypothetical protein Thiowin_01961 [Thiorhodovibrio winogradskyi]|uniref:Uncharacterized protein n=1 Tax=Thiorhodovibrio winogradskyi TaxID=77007 RepID=A0ABZ0S9M3_9GAMM|nr:hypothetical protein [Thiorhodovibrio winogradskyi]